MSRDNEPSVDTVHWQNAETQTQTLTDAILSAIEHQRGDDFRRTDFSLFEDINPDGLNQLFKPNAQSTTTVTLTTDGLRVDLRGDGDVEIRVKNRTSE